MTPDRAPQALGQLLSTIICRENDRDSTMWHVSWSAQDYQKWHLWLTVSSMVHDMPCSMGTCSCLAWSITWYAACACLQSSQQAHADLSGALCAAPTPRARKAKDAPPQQALQGDPVTWQGFGRLLHHIADHGPSMAEHDLHAGQRLRATCLMLGACTGRHARVTDATLSDLSQSADPALVLMHCAEVEHVLCLRVVNESLPCRCGTRRGSACQKTQCFAQTGAFKGSL